MPEQWITVGSYSTPYEAGLAMAELQSFDLDATLKDDNAIHINWLWSNALGGIKLQVPESELGDALRVLAAEPAVEPADDPSEPVICPKCGGSRTGFFLDRRGCFLTWLVLGIPVLPAFPRRVCDDCGKRWKPQ